MKRAVRQIAVVLLMVMLVVNASKTVRATSTQEKLDKAKEEKKQTQSALEQTKENIQGMQGAKNSLQGQLSELNDKEFEAITKLERDLKKIDKDDVIPASQAMAHVIIPDMEKVRQYADEMETLTSSEFWPYPTYFDILYGVK